jgi:diadenosine tetraphosphate (Ap4A) HIT family hydrolase
MNTKWPTRWNQLIQGIGCEMCDSDRPDEDKYGIRIHKTKNTDTVLQRADIQRGYTLVIWRGRHVTEPFELTDLEASGYWLTVLKVAKVLAEYYKPLKMNYETLGNSLPHLHTHLVPRYIEDDPAPGRPFPLLPQNGRERAMPEVRLQTEAADLRALLDS